MTVRRPRGAIALLVVSVCCSAVSLGSLLLHTGAGNVRTALNVAALLCVITATTMLVRGSRHRDE